MKREIKFRLWYPLLKSMQRALVMYFNNKELYFIVKGTSQINVPFDKVVLMQYTGLKDKNGKEIYEGDIFKGETNFKNCKNGKTSKEKFMFQIVWRDNGFQCYRKDQDHYFSLGYATICENIGNIYENPELI